MLIELKKGLEVTDESDEENNKNLEKIDEKSSGVDKLLHDFNNLKLRT